MQNAILIAAIALLLFIAFRFFATKSKPKNYANISGSEFQVKMKEPNTVILDVRTSGELSGGIIKGAKHFIDYMNSSFEKEIEKLDKNKHYLVYCRSGNRSSKACELMGQHGFTQVSNLAGGFMLWKGEVASKK